MQKLRLIFNNKGYFNWFINKTLKKIAAKNSSQKTRKIFFLLACRVLEILDANLLKKLSVFGKTKFNVDTNVYYTAFKTGPYFRLKCSTALSLMSNVMYKFNCSRDADLSYIGMIKRHLSVRVREHLHSKVRTAVVMCTKKKPVGVNDFKITRTCIIEYNTKIQEVLLIKKCNPKLNSQMCASGSLFLFNVFELIFRIFYKYRFYVTHSFSMLYDDCIT